MMCMAAWLIMYNVHLQLLRDYRTLPWIQGQLVWESLVTRVECVLHPEVSTSKEKPIIT